MATQRRIQKVSRKSVFFRLESRAQAMRGLGGPDPPNLDGPPHFFYVAVDCSARNWVYHPYFVLYNNLGQGIGPPTLKTWLRPCLEWRVLVILRGICENPGTLYIRVPTSNSGGVVPLSAVIYPPCFQLLSGLTDTHADAID